MVEVEIDCAETPILLECLEALVAFFRKCPPYINTRDSAMSWSRPLHKNAHKMDTKYM